MIVGARADHVRSYYAALNTGDPEAVSAHFTDDAVHWYTRRPPSAGAVQIGEHTHLAVEHLQADWRIEHLIEGEDEVVIEWSMSYSRDGDLIGFDHAGRGHTVLAG